jgi:hypothetical protein
LNGGGKAGRGLLVLLTATLIVQQIAESARWLIGGGPPPASLRGSGSPKPFLTRGLAALLLAVVVVVLVDWLGYAANNQVTTLNKRWWGPAQESPWIDAANQKITFLDRGLTIDISGDELIARYEVTALSKSPITSTAESDNDAGAGDDLVNSLLGDVLVGEFHYGVTGHQLQADTLSFKAPRIQIARDKKKRLITTIVASSYPDRLDEHRQRITILPPNMGMVAGPVTAIQVTTPGVQIARPAGVDIRSVAKDTADLQLNQATVRQADNASFTVSEGNSSSGWFEGLRAVGGLTLPIVDAFLERMLFIFMCCIFLWSFFRARRKFPDDQLVNVSLKTTELTVAALAAIAIVGFAWDLSTKVWGTADRSYLAAGPMALLVGGAVAIWPVACWRAGVAGAGHPNPAHNCAGPAARSLRRHGLVVVLMVHLAIAVLYLVRLHRLGVWPLTVSLAVGTILTLVIIPTMVRILLGRGPLTWVASTGLLVAAFVAATSWPLLYSATNWFSSDARSAHINQWGKWMYLSAAVVTAAGLCVTWGRVAWTALCHSRQKSRTVPILTVAAVAAIILAAIVPDVVSESGISNPHAVGLAPFDLFSLFDNIPSLLLWLLLILAIVVTMRLSSEPNPWPVARDLALPIAVSLLYWFDTWLYIPVSVIAGIFLIRWRMMPAALADEKPSTSNPETLAGEATAGWRRAEFLTSQQQALAATSTEALRKSLLGSKNREFQRRLARLADAQDDLAVKRDKSQRVARKAISKVFSHRGAMPDPRSAAFGTLVGTVLGIIPAGITMLTTQPPLAGGSYPVLSFFGDTAWNLLTYTGLGWFVGYFLPLIRGDSGAAKALWIFVTSIVASLPDNLIWNDASDWIYTMVNDLDLLVFLLVLTVIVCDLRTLQRATLRPTDWVRVHNWRFVASWSAALVAAIGTIVLTFATTTVTALSEQLTQPPSTSNQNGTNPVTSGTSSNRSAGSSTSSGSTGGGRSNGG